MKAARNQRELSKEQLVKLSQGDGQNLIYDLSRMKPRDFIPIMKALKNYAKSHIFNLTFALDYYYQYCQAEYPFLKKSTKAKHKGEQVILENNSTSERAISAETANIMCEMLQTVITDPQGTTRPYGISGYPTMAKSGTTTDDHDRWFIGGTPYYVSAVWYGYDTQKEITGVYLNPSGNIFKKVMDEIHEGLPSKDFPKSENVVERKYCTETGLLATDSCPSTKTGWYNKEALPATCTAHSGSSSDSEETTAAAED